MISYLRKLSLILLLTLGLTTSSYADQVVNTSIVAYQHAKNQGYTSNTYFIYVDFTKPSTEKRLFVYNSSTNQIVYSTWVAHGIGSGNGSYVTSVSNIPNSLSSSVGVYRTAEVYIGKHGRSVRLDGLEQGYNNNIRVRDIVIHTAPYIGNGKTGHSWGCLAIPDDAMPTILFYTHQATIIVVYYPSSSWLNNSRFLH